MVYTPMDGSPTINLLVYTHIGGSPKNKVNPYTVVGNWIVKYLTKFY